jgi:hypothetical protein
VGKVKEIPIIGGLERTHVQIIVKKRKTPESSSFSHIPEKKQVLSPLFWKDEGGRA